MKGQSAILEYVLSVILGVLVFMSVVALFLGFYNNLIENEIRDELKQVVFQTSDSVLRLYDAGKSSKAAPTNNTVLLISELDLNLPVKVAKRNYEMTLQPTPTTSSVVSTITVGNRNVSFVRKISGAKLVARTTEDPIVKVEYGLPNLDASVQGSIFARGNATLRFYRYNSNSTIYDTIVLGDSYIIIRVTSVTG